MTSVSSNSPQNNGIPKWGDNQLEFTNKSFASTENAQGEDKSYSIFDSNKNEIVEKSDTVLSQHLCKETARMRKVGQQNEKFAICVQLSRKFFNFV